MTQTKKQEAIDWLRNDAAYLRKRAEKYRSEGRIWLADLVAENAKHSDQQADEQEKL